MKQKLCYSFYKNRANGGLWYLAQGGGVKKAKKNNNLMNFCRISNTGPLQEILKKLKRIKYFSVFYLNKRKSC